MSYEKEIEDAALAWVQAHTGKPEAWDGFIAGAKWARGARECFLAMLADANEFTEECDGDETGSWVMFTLVTAESQLRELCEALGIKPKWMQSTMEAIQEALDAPIGGTNAQSGQTNTADGD